MGSGFKDIVDLKRWQTIQNHFSEVLRVTLRTIDTKGNLLISPSLYTSLHNGVMQSTAESILNCQDCIPLILNSAVNWKQGCICPNGFYNFPIPLKVKRETFAYFVVGPVILGKRKEKEAYRKMARDLNIDPEQFLDAVREISVFSFNGINSVIELLSDIGLCVCELGYQNLKLKDLLPQAPNLLERVHEFYRERLLGALLDIAYELTEADRGSIMLVDKTTNELYIKMAKGLKKEIVDTVRLKIGEGLAGIAAQEQKPLFINDTIKDERILTRCNNPELKNSILMPIRLKDKLLGVLNIATHKAAADKFTSQSIETMDKLGELVETTLADLPQTSVGKTETLDPIP